MVRNCCIWSWLCPTWCVHRVTKWSLRMHKQCPGLQSTPLHGESTPHLHPIDTPSTPHLHPIYTHLHPSTPHLHPIYTPYTPIYTHLHPFTPIYTPSTPHLHPCTCIYTRSPPCTLLQDTPHWGLRHVAVCHHHDGHMWYNWYASSIFLEAQNLQMCKGCIIIDNGCVCSMCVHWIMPIPIKCPGIGQECTNA